MVTGIAQEMEAAAQAPRLHLEAADGIDAAAGNMEQATYVNTGNLDPQWMIAYKMFVDAEGEYGVPLPVPIGQFSSGANALVNMRRQDGGKAWTAIRPTRVSPQGTIECVVDRCGDAHLGGKRKMVATLDQLIKHVRAFHFDEFETYGKYFDQISDQLALSNPRLMKLMDLAGGAKPGAVVTDGPMPFYCDDDECTRYFDSPQGLQMHKNRDHKA